MRKGELSSMTSMTSMTLPPLRKRISEAAAVSDQGVLVQGEVGIAAGLIQSTSGDAALLTTSKCFKRELWPCNETQSQPFPVTKHRHCRKALKSVRHDESLTWTTLVGRTEVRDCRPFQIHKMAYGFPMETFKPLSFNDLKTS